MMNIVELPDEIIIQILLYIDVRALSEVFLVCQEFGKFQKHEYLWEDKCRTHNFNLKGKDVNESYLDYFKNKYQTPGDLYFWGRDVSGNRSILSPTNQHYFLTRNVKDAFCQRNALSVLVESGDVFVSGKNEKCRLAGHDDQKTILSPLPIKTFPNNRRIKQVSHGDSISLFLSHDGLVWGVGDNSKGLIDSSEGALRIFLLPQRIHFDQKIIQVCSSPIFDGSFCCVDLNGVLFSWGANEFGQLGHGNIEFQKVPKMVEKLKEIRVRSVCMGNWHTIVLTRDGRLFSFGDGAFGQLGFEPQNEKKGTFTPQSIQFFSENKIRVEKISCGQSHNAVVDENGKCYTWGNGFYGQIGNGKKQRTVFNPSCVTKFVNLDGGVVLLESQYRFLDVCSGSNHCVGLIERICENEKLKKKVVIAWGCGTYGRLGLGDEKDRNVPTEVRYLGTKNIRKIGAGGHSSICVVKHEWVSSDEVSECCVCLRPWSKFRCRRHHCRNCFGIFCGKCSRKKAVVKTMGFERRVRVCDGCFKLVEEKKKENE